LTDFIIFFAGIFVKDYGISLKEKTQCVRPYFSVDLGKFLPGVGNIDQQTAIRR
jgi:hypothetical protein